MFSENRHDIVIKASYLHRSVQFSYGPGPWMLVSILETDADKAMAVERLAVIFIALGIALPALSLWIFSKYQITQEVHESNLSELGYQDED